MTSSPPVHREACGTRLGKRLHSSMGEELCAGCRAHEEYVALLAEAHRPVPEPPALSTAPALLDKLIALVASVVEEDEARRARALRGRGAA